MNKLTFIAFFLWLISCSYPQAQKAPEIKSKLSLIDTSLRQHSDNKAACQIITTFLDEYITEEKLDSVQVIDEVRDWNIEENLEYTFRGYNLLPKTEKERQKRLKLLTEPVENPFPFIYVYAYPITDQLFTKSDREYIKAYASKNMGSIQCIQNSKVKLVAREDKNRYQLSFATPLFTEDSSKVILSVYHDAFFYKEAGHMGRNQYIYFTRNRDGSFRRVFATTVEEITY